MKVKPIEELPVIFEDNSVISVKEARKLLGKSFQEMSDEQIENIVSLLTNIANVTITKGSKIRL